MLESFLRVWRRGVEGEWLRVGRLRVKVPPKGGIIQWETPGSVKSTLRQNCPSHWLEENNKRWGSMPIELKLDKLEQAKMQQIIRTTNSYNTSIDSDQYLRVLSNAWKFLTGLDGGRLRVEIFKNEIFSKSDVYPRWYFFEWEYHPRRWHHPVGVTRLNEINFEAKLPISLIGRK